MRRDAEGRQTAVEFNYAGVKNPAVDAMIKEIDRIATDFSNGGHIFNLGHGVVPETPPEHVAALADQLRDLKTDGG